MFNLLIFKFAFQLFIHSLPVDCYVNVVGFGSTFQFLFPEGSRKYSDQVLQICKAHAESINNKTLLFVFVTIKHFLS